MLIKLGLSGLNHRWMESFPFNCEQTCKVFAWLLLFQSIQYQIPPCNINTLENRLVLRIKDLILKNSPRFFYRKLIRAQNENLNFDVRV